MKWERLIIVRTALLILAGLTLLVAGAYVLLGLGAGLVAAGAALLLLEFLTGQSEVSTSEQRQ
jgi:hypothetical protein